jgi:hypothetical protein
MHLSAASIAVERCVLSTQLDRTDGIQVMMDMQYDPSRRNGESVCNSYVKRSSQLWPVELK